jgi:small-conductance mechanosensitive channel
MNMPNNLPASVGRLLLDLWHDLSDPQVLWQVLVLGVCLALAWLMVRSLRRYVSHSLWGSAAPNGRAGDAMRFGLAGLRRILFPLLALLLVMAARPALALWHHVNLLHLAVSLLASLVMVRFMVFLMRSALPQGNMLVAFERSASVMVWGALALHLTGLLPELIGFLDSIRLLLPGRHVTLWLVLQAVFWTVVTLLLALWAGTAVEGRLMQAESLHTSSRVALSRLLRSLLVVLAVLLVLPLVGIDLTVLSVFGGALGVGLGFGLQKIASNYVSGFIILLDRSIRIGDVITTDQFNGVVKNITSRYVVVKAGDGREAIIPNETLITQTVQNHTHSDSLVRVTVQVQVGYDSDVEQALSLLVSLAREHPRLLGDPPPAAWVVRMADSGIDLELGAWLNDPQLGMQVIRSDLYRAIIKAFREQGIDIPYPQRVVHQLPSKSVS